MSSRAGESSKIKVQGSLKWHKNRAQIALDCGLVLGSHFSEKIYHFGWKNDSQMDPKLQLKLDLGPVRTPYFHPWVDKVAQVVTNGAQSGSRGAQSTPKRDLNGVKVGHKVSKTCSRSPNMMQNGDQQLEKYLPMGCLPLSYIYSLGMCSHKSVTVI